MPACAACNQEHKSGHFTVFTEPDDTTVELAPGSPPPPGDPVLLNPRLDDAMEYLELDRSGTFRFVLRDDLTARQEQRARYTLRLLGLNDRDNVLLGRKEAYRFYLERLKSGLRDPAAMEHPTVWAEMKRQHALIPELQALFDQAPAALDW